MSAYRDRRDRDPYREVCEWGRKTIDRALAAEPVSVSDLRTLLVVLREVAFSSRTHDAITRSRVAEIGGVSERQVSRSTHRLSEYGVISWRSGGSERDGYRLPSHVTLARPVTDNGQGSEPGPVTDGRHLSTVRPVTERAPTGDRKTPRPVTDSCPTTEGDRVKTEGEPVARAVAMLTRQTDPLPKEVAEKIAALRTKHGAAQLTAALDALEADGARFSWPSELAKALDTHASKPTVKCPECRVVLEDGACPICGNRHFPAAGWLRPVRSTA